MLKPDEGSNPICPMCLNSLGPEIKSFVIFFFFVEELLNPQPDFFSFSFGGSLFKETT
jgi:hypothetical protein